MIIKFKKNVTLDSINKVKQWALQRGIQPHEIKGVKYTVLGLVGDTSSISTDIVKSMDMVAEVKRIQEPYKLSSRTFNPQDKIITLSDGTKIGGDNFVCIAGPCSVESEEQILKIAKSVKKSGAGILRGGAFKPRTSPYSFQGMGFEGIRLLEIAKKETNIPIISEIMEVSQLEYFENVDILQVGARNMQNYELLKELGKINKPVLLKRGLSATYEEFLLSAEYIMAGGNEDVILCERGIRTFETGTRNTLDITSVPYIQEKSPLPIIIDPSHSAGLSKYVPPLSVSATAIGVNGLMIEVHNDPKNALSDGMQALNLTEFEQLSKKVFKLREFLKENEDM